MRFVRLLRRTVPGKFQLARVWEKSIQFHVRTPNSFDLLRNILKTHPRHLMPSIPNTGTPCKLWRLLRTYREGSPPNRFESESLRRLLLPFGFPPPSTSSRVEGRIPAKFRPRRHPFNRPPPPANSIRVCIATNPLSAS